MTKSLASLWLKSLSRVGRAQQAQGRKLFKSLLPQAVRRPAVKRAITLKPVKVQIAKLARAVKPRRKPLAATRRTAAVQPALPGT